MRKGKKGLELNIKDFIVGLNDEGLLVYKESKNIISTNVDNSVKYVFDLLTKTFIVFDPSKHWAFHIQAATAYFEYLERRSPSNRAELYKRFVGGYLTIIDGRIRNIDIFSNYFYEYTVKYGLVEEFLNQFTKLFPNTLNEAQIKQIYKSGYDEDKDDENSEKITQILNQGIDNKNQDEL